ncbi:PAS domain-containing protein [Halobaculum litoreum]|uniref:PAS domain-containing protein n=1 Tax=Halobaculum litoreum TaxID=3031998 RepID=A0ABD5XRP1_9EURY
MYGRSRAELEGDPRSFLETVHPDDLPAVRKAMEALTAGEAVDIEYRINPDRDHDRWCGSKPNRSPRTGRSPGSPGSRGTSPTVTGGCGSCS